MLRAAMSLATKILRRLETGWGRGPEIRQEWLCSQGDEAVVGLGAQERHAYRHDAG
jgi:hypothetical protein